MCDPTLIQGGRVVLRSAGPEDRRTILDWLFRSDVTPAMLGSPLYPERPIPPHSEAEGGYDAHYFDGSAPELGRSYLILADGEPMGQVSYNDIHERAGERRVELDIWMRSEECCGKGYGTDALEALCRHLHERFGVVAFLLQPSGRNTRAIRAYEKAGFVKLDASDARAREDWGPADYDDSVFMVKTLSSSATRPGDDSGSQLSA